MSTEEVNVTATPVPIDVDPETGEKLYIRHNMVLVDAFPTDLLKMDAKAMRTFAVAVVKTSNFDERHMPFIQKIKFLWSAARELFWPKPVKADPFYVAAFEWCQKQERPLTLKEKLQKYMVQVRKVFVPVKVDPNALDTFGLPGMMPRKTSSSLR